MKDFERIMNRKRTVFIISSIVFVIAFAVLAVFVIPRNKYSFPMDVNKLDVVIVGDSLFCNKSFIVEEKTLGDVLKDELDCEMQNCSIGGTCASRLNNENELDFYSDMLGFYNVSNMIVTGNKSSISDNARNLTGTFPDAHFRLSFLVGTDMSKEDILIVNYGINDALLRVPVKSDDLYDEYTYSGAMRRGIERIVKRYPDLKIVLGEVTYSTLILFGEEDEYYDEVTQEYRNAYNEELKKIADEFPNVYYFDFSSNTKIDAGNYDKYLTDGIHFNEEGKKIYASALADFIGEIK